MLFWWPKFWAWQVFGTKPWQLTIGQDRTRTPPPFPWGSYKKRWDGVQGRLTKRQLATACCCCQKDKNRHGSRFSQIMFFTIWFMVLFWHLGILFLILFLHFSPLEKIHEKEAEGVLKFPKNFLLLNTQWRCNCVTDVTVIKKASFCGKWNRLLNGSKGPFSAIICRDFFGRLISCSWRTFCSPPFILYQTYTLGNFSPNSQFYHLHQMIICRFLSQDCLMCILL